METMLEEMMISGLVLAQDEKTEPKGGLLGWLLGLFN